MKVLFCDDVPNTIQELAEAVKDACADDDVGVEIALLAGLDDVDVLAGIAEPRDGIDIVALIVNHHQAKTIAVNLFDAIVCDISWTGDKDDIQGADFVEGMDPQFPVCLVTDGPLRAFVEQRGKLPALSGTRNITACSKNEDQKVAQWLMNTLRAWQGLRTLENTAADGCRLNTVLLRGALEGLYHQRLLVPPGDVNLLVDLAISEFEQLRSEMPAIDEQLQRFIAQLRLGRVVPNSYGQLFEALGRDEDQIDKGGGPSKNKLSSEFLRVQVDDPDVLAALRRLAGGDQVACRFLTPDEGFIRRKTNSQSANSGPAKAYLPTPLLQQLWFDVMRHGKPEELWTRTDRDRSGPHVIWSVGHSGVGFSSIADLQRAAETHRFGELARFSRLVIVSRTNGLLLSVQVRTTGELRKLASPEFELGDSHWTVNIERGTVYVLVIPTCEQGWPGFAGNS